MKKLIRHILAGLAAVTLCAVLVVAWGTLSFARAGRQVFTFANMRIIAERLDQAIQAGAHSRSELLPIVRSVNKGKDGWGRDFILELRASSLGVEYVLISTGSDGRLDLPTTADYFSLTESDVDGQYRRDIVFRNGQPVTLAGK